MIPREEDTTSSMYPRPDGSPIQKQPLSTSRKKVDVVCDSLRSAMEAMSVNKSVRQSRLWGNLFQIQPTFSSSSVKYCSEYCITGHWKTLKIEPKSMKANSLLSCWNKKKNQMDQLFEVLHIFLNPSHAAMFSLCFESIRPQTFSPMNAVGCYFDPTLLPPGSSCPY